MRKESPLKIESREYKLLIKHETFNEGEGAAAIVWDQIVEVANTMPSVRTKGKFDEQETRTILFLDTSDHTLRKNGLLLRQRVGDDGVEYTLKCRSEDRYFVVGTSMTPAKNLRQERKLEEDIAPPFRCRLSQSTTITLTGPEDRKLPTTLRKAAAMFPVLGELSVNGMLCAPGTELSVVSSIIVKEIVFKGGKLVFETANAALTDASVALILWTRGLRDRPAIAELSFRIKESEEGFSRELAAAARTLYTLLLRLDCARRDGMTKTEYIYRDTTAD